MARDPRVVEFANYLAKCPEDAAVNWLVRHRSIPIGNILDGEFAGLGVVEDKPEWDQLLDGVLYLRRSSAINSALARYGSSTMAAFLQNRDLSKSDTVNLAANPTAYGMFWLAIERSDNDILRAVLQNPALSTDVMAIVLGAKRAGFGGKRVPLDVSVDDIAMRLYFISDNERFRRAAKGVKQPEDASQDYIGFPWNDLKDRLGELILSLPVRADTAIAVTKALYDFDAGLMNHIKVADPIAAIERWKVVESDYPISTDLMRQFKQDSVGVKMAAEAVARAVIPGRIEWMMTDHHEAFGGFCHNVKALGKYDDGVDPDDLLSDEFGTRVRAWQERGRGPHDDGYENPFFDNEYMWLTPERRRVVRKYTSWRGGFTDERAYVRRLAWLKKNNPSMVIDEPIDENVEDEIDGYSLDDVRKDMLTIYDKFGNLERNRIPMWTKIVAILAIVSSAIWIGWEG